jgi:hypothetical protein
MANTVKGTASMKSVTAVRHVVVLFVLLGSSSGVRAADNFVLLVNTTTGHVAMRSDFPSTVWINQYSIASAAGSLRPLQWNSLDDQNADGKTWDETSATTTLLSESNASGETSFQNGTGFAIGAAFLVGTPQDLVFHYRLAGSTTLSLGQVTYVTVLASPPNPVHEVMPCPGDINGSGAINVDDLLQVINSWGPCSPPPGTCPADIAPVQLGNGTVNVDDLLAVINAWGVCP